MGLYLSTVFALVLWVVLWALGAKAFDSLMLAGIIVLVAAASRIIAPSRSTSRGSSG